MSVVNLSEFVIGNNLTKVIVIVSIYFSFYYNSNCQVLRFTLPEDEIQHGCSTYKN